MQGCLWEQGIHISLYQYSFSRKSGIYYCYKGKRVILSPKESFISYSCLLTNVMQGERWLHLCVPLPSLAELQGSDWIAAYSVSDQWYRLAKCCFQWKHCDRVQLQELKMHSLIPSSSKKFFLALASLLLFTFLNWEVRRTPTLSVLKRAACACEGFFILCNKRSNKNVWIDMNCCKCMHISIHFQKLNYAKPGLVTVTFQVM